ncbi:helix-turn-helix domain-containing protein [Cytobacillus praedii]|uniref:XRE family transcriptional regulator n=1 Tax=Cytobacillus praedii TaxID=1742358 RepID=A0A4R1AK73_9BACI|nr:helix-turn-helix transcriptional regulator [Cytobacillus praedii]TCJ00012.1 XRE family transcriptional regulator [Cytobacillus praedii]
MNKHKGYKQTRQITYDQMKVYGEKFEKLRKSINFSLNEMSEAIGVSLSTLHRWEKGKLIPQTDIDYIERKIENVAAKVLIY